MLKLLVYGYLLNIFDRQGGVEYVPLLDDAGDAERMVYFPETIHRKLEQCYIVFIFRDVCPQEFDALASVL